MSTRFSLGLGCTDLENAVSCPNQRSVSRSHEGYLFYS